MIGDTNDGIRNSLATHPELRCEGKEVVFADPQSPPIRINLRVDEPHQLIYLARLLAALGYEEAHFRHSYLWLTTWGVWDGGTEAVAFKIFEQFRRSHGENRSLESAPGTHFRHDEFVESVCCLVQPILVGWDAYYVPTWAYGSLDYFVFVSHDGFADIRVRTPEVRQQCEQALSGYNWIQPLMK